MWILQTTRVMWPIPTVEVSVAPIAQALTPWLFHRSCTKSCGTRENTRTPLGTAMANSLLSTALATRECLEPLFADKQPLTYKTVSDTDSMGTTSLDGKMIPCRRLWTPYPVASAPMPTAVFLKFSLPRTPWLARRLNKQSKTLARMELGSRNFQEALLSFELK